MAFLDFMKKREELPTDIDLDMPPEPPKIIGEETSTEGPIDEELAPLKKEKLKLKTKVSKEEELSELPPLPEIGEKVPELPPLPGAGEEFPELPPLPEEEGELGALPKPEEHELAPLPEAGEEFPELPPLPEEEGLGELDLPPPLETVKKEKKGLFSFLKLKKAAEELPLPKMGEGVPELPPLPEAGEEFPELPPLPGEGGKELPEIHPLPEKEELPPLPKIEEEITVPKPLRAVEEKVVPKKEIKPVKKFIMINDFRQIQDSIGETKDILKGISGFFGKVDEVKGIGDKEYAGLCNDLQDIHRKIMFVDKTLFKEV